MEKTSSWLEIEEGSLAERLSREADAPGKPPWRRRALDFERNLRAILAPELEVRRQGEEGVALRWRAGVYEPEGTPRVFEAVVRRDPLLSITTSNNPARARRPRKLYSASRLSPALAGVDQVCRPEECPFHSTRIGTDPAGYLLVPGHCLRLGEEVVRLRVTSAKVNLYPSLPGQFVVLAALDHHRRLAHRPVEETRETLRALQWFHRVAREEGTAKGLDLWVNEGALGFATLPHPHWQVRPRFDWERHFIEPFPEPGMGAALVRETLWSGRGFALALEPSLAELRLLAREPAPFDALDAVELAEVLRRVDLAFERLGVSSYNFMVCAADFDREAGRLALIRIQAREEPYTSSNQAGLEFLHNGRFRMVALDLERLREAVVAELNR
ncbi:MAG: hypothetical protein ACE5JJ_03960 [Nitrospinota bacterium]